MKIQVDDIRDCPHRRLTVEFKEDLAGLSAVKPVVGELTLIAGTAGVKLTGWVKTLLKLNCDRCLRPFFQSIGIELDETFVYDIARESHGSQHGEARELLKDDFVDTVPSDGNLDISDIVYQAVTLATPTFSLCGDECPGPPLPANHEASDASKVSGQNTSRQYGEKDPIDPRWKNLKTLFPNEESQGNS